MAGRERMGWWFSALSAVPWLVIVGAYLEACVARMVLSRWPRPMFDDPKQLATAPLHSAIQILLVSLFVTIPLVIFWAVWNWRKIFSDWRYRACIGAFAAGLLAFWALAHYDPGRVWYWFFD